MCILHRTFHYQMSQRGWLPESALSSSSFFPSRSSISTPFPFLPSTSVLVAKKRRRALHQLSGPSARWDPTLPLSLSPLFLPLSFSPPLVVTEHTCLILATRAPSPITSQPLRSLIPWLDFWESSSPLLFLPWFYWEQVGELSYPSVSASWRPCLFVV